MLLLFVTRLFPGFFLHVSLLRITSRLLLKSQIHYLEHIIYTKWNIETVMFLGTSLLK